MIPPEALLSPKNYDPHQSEETLSPGEYSILKNEDLSLHSHIHGIAAAAAKAIEIRKC